MTATGTTSTITTTISTAPSMSRRYRTGSEGGSPPATTTSAAPATTLAPPTTLPPPTAPPTTLPPAQPDNRGKGEGGGVQKQFEKWLEELQKQFEDAQKGG